jgi:preprotein translocase subunit SecF
MEFFRIRRDIPFMRHALVFNLISLVTFLAAVFFLVTRGLHLSVEFTGGTVMEVEYAQAADIGRVRATVQALNLGEVQVQKFGTSRDVLIRLPIRGDIKQSEVVSRVFAQLCSGEKGSIGTRQQTGDKGEVTTRQVCEVAGAEPLKLSRSEFVGPQVGKELAEDGLKALAFVVVGIMEIGRAHV